MKNCATIVSLSLCCLCFCAPVFSSENSSFTDNSQVRFQQKKIAPLMSGRFQEIPLDAVCWNLQFGNTSVGSLSFEAEEPATGSVFNWAMPLSFVPNSSQRLLKNYLLHLFPSHYFW